MKFLKYNSDVQAYIKKYYLYMLMPYKNPEDRKAYRDKYYQEHKEELQQHQKERRQTEEYKEREKEYRLVNKEKIAERDNTKFECGCGGCYTRKNKLVHERGKSHIYWSKTGINTYTLEFDSNWHQHLKELMKEENKN